MLMKLKSLAIDYTMSHINVDGLFFPFNSPKNRSNTKSHRVVNKQNVSEH